MGFPFVAVTWDTNLVFWVSKTYHLTGLVLPFYHPGNHFVSLGTPEGTMEGHMEVQNQMTESTPRSDWIRGGKALAC